MLTTKQRAYLRSLANPLSDTLLIGKDGMTEQVRRQLEQLLDAHELVKGKVLNNSLLSPYEASNALCAETGAEPVQCIGNKFVVYRPASEQEKRKIVLPK